MSQLKIQALGQTQKSCITDNKQEQLWISFRDMFPLTWAGK